MAGNDNYDALLTTTMANYHNQLIDNIFNARALTYWLMQKNRVRFVSGGSKIVEQLMYGKNNTVSSYSRYDPISLAPQEGLTAAEYDWKQFAGSVAISGIEEAMNDGEEALLDLLEAKVTQTEETMQEDLNLMLYGNGTGNGGKDMNGLGNLIEASGTVGGIDRATNSWWRSYEENTATALTQALMTTAYNSVSKGNKSPDFALTTQLLYEKYESLLTPNLRYNDTKTADAGFQNLLFKGKPVMYDDACTAGVMYFLNSKYIKLVGYKKKWFKQGAWVTPEDTDARFSLILTYGNLIVNNSRMHGKLTAKTA